MSSFAIYMVMNRDKIAPVTIHIIMRSRMFASLFALWICVGFSNAGRSDCPLIACPAIMYPPTCRTTTFFIDAKNQNDQVCQGCDACIERAEDAALADGCPLRACTMQLIPDQCRRDRYFVYQGRTICKDCPEDICRNNN